MRARGAAASLRGNIVRPALPAAAIEPFIDQRQPVGSPERLGIDEEERRAKDAARDRFRGDGPELLLQFVGIQRQFELADIGATFGGRSEHRILAETIDAFTKIAVEYGLGERDGDIGRRSRNQ